MDTTDQRVEHGKSAGWLAPLALDPSRKKVPRNQTARRASHLGCLPMTLEQYLSLLDWTGRQVRKDKIGSIPSDSAPVLERLNCSAESWLDLVRNFRKRFRTKAGLSKSVVSVHATRQSRRHASSQV